jgi:hypothetical protein
MRLFVWHLPYKIDIERYFCLHLPLCKATKIASSGRAPANASEHQYARRTPSQGRSLPPLRAHDSRTRGIVRKVLAEKVSEPIMVGASKAGDLLGVSRAQFYNFRMKYPRLKGLAFTLGDGDKLYWLVDDLKAWAREVRDAQAGAGGSSADPSDLPPSDDSLDEAA